MSETSLSDATSSEHFNRAAAALKAAERDAHAAIDSAVDGLASVYGETKPLLARVGKQARGYVNDGYDAARQQAAALRERSAAAVDSTRGYVRDEPVTLQGWDGYALDIEDAEGAIVMMRTYIVKDRLYRMLVTAKYDTTTRAAATRFLDSLRLSETRQ